MKLKNRKVRNISKFSYYIALSKKKLKDIDIEEGDLIDVTIKKSNELVE